MQGYVKDPDATLDFVVDWSEWLVADTIATSDWIVQTGLTEAAASDTDTTATVWLSGGVVGVEYQVTCRITTTGGRTDDRTIVIQCLST